MRDYSFYVCHSQKCSIRIEFSPGDAVAPSRTTQRGNISSCKQCDCRDESKLRMVEMVETLINAPSSIRPKYLPDVESVGAEAFDLANGERSRSIR